MAPRNHTVTGPVSDVVNDDSRRARYFTFYSSNWVAPRLRALSSSIAKPYEVTKTSRWATFHVTPLEFIL